MRLRVHALDVVADAGLREDGGRGLGADPPVGRDDLDPVLAGEEHRGSALARARVEHPHPWTQIEVLRQVLQQPQGVGAHVELEQARMQNS
ncbi:hypothetical protein ACTWPT_34610 [Nonomuraea sp. 3N208]|uniref:hypothetical protein n=1 Tax=Nonomuraea sp. 3N208 TaxID=3457421 RepID=UPI003FD23A42